MTLMTFYDVFADFYYIFNIAFYLRKTGKSNHENINSFFSERMVTSCLTINWLLIDVSIRFFKER